MAGREFSLENTRNIGIVSGFTFLPGFYTLDALAHGYGVGSKKPAKALCKDISISYPAFGRFYASIHLSLQSLNLIEQVVDAKCYFTNRYTAHGNGKSPGSAAPFSC